MPLADPSLPAISPELLISQFKPEIEQIKDPELRLQVLTACAALPMWFWFIPAALGGKNHPPDECGIGGLTHHTKKVVFFVRYICRLYDMKDEPIRDRAIAAAILHDSLKYAPEDATYTQAWELGREWSKTHPITCARFAQKYGVPDDICLAIASHYGPFLETPLSNWQKDGPMNLTQILFLADGLSASPHNQQPFGPEEIIGGIESLKLDNMKKRLLEIGDFSVEGHRRVQLSPIAYHTLRKDFRTELSLRKVEVLSLPTHGASVVEKMAGGSVISSARLFDHEERLSTVLGSF